MSLENMDKDKQKELLELYKLHVKQVSKISTLRQVDARFYVGANLLLLGSTAHFQLGILNFFGVAICIIWIFSIMRYKRINSAKFKLLLEMEKELVYPFFTKEYKALSRKIKLRYVDYYLSILFIVGYINIFLYY